MISFDKYINKTEYFGFSKEASSYFRSYLSTGTFNIVHINKSCFKPEDLLCGVPQGKPPI